MFSFAPILSVSNRGEEGGACPLRNAGVRKPETQFHGYCVAVEERTDLGLNGYTMVGWVTAVHYNFEICQSLSLLVC